MYCMQASKRDEAQGSIAEVLEPLPPNSSVDVLVVGCGPAGMYLAAQLAKKGLKTGLIGKQLRPVAQKQPCIPYNSMGT